MELTPPDPRIGQVLQGRYRILARVASGAMGVVYRGERVELGRPVAVKFLHPWIASQQAFRSRFETEARAMSRLSHPNCVSVMDFGIEGTSPYVVMDFVAGDTLRQVLERGRLPPPRAVAITRQLLAGVAHAHAQGIIHRDLKPENLMLGDSAGLADHVRILDFGLAKLRDGPAMTSGLAIGTPSYMSPEQAGAPGEIDGRTDIYALGILLFEMLAGRKPFIAEKVADILLMHRDVAPPSLRAVVPGAEISVELEHIVNRAMAKAPEGRFSTVVEFAHALDGIPEALAARSRGNFPASSSAEKAAAEAVAATAGALLAEGDKTIADPMPSHLLPPSVVVSPPANRAKGEAAPPGGPAAAGAPSLAGADENRATDRDGAAAFRLTRARGIGLGAVALLALVLVLLGLRRQPTPARAPVAETRTSVTAGAGKGEVQKAAPPVRGQSPHVAPADPGAGALSATASADLATRPTATGAALPVVPSLPPSADDRLRSAQGLVAAGEWEQALVVLEKARRENPQNATVAYELANLSLEHKRWIEGAQAARVAGEREPKYRGDERLVKNLIRALGSDKGYEKTEDVLHGFGAAALPLLKNAAAHDKNPLVRQRAAELVRSRSSGNRVSARPANATATRKSSSRSLFSR